MEEVGGAQTATLGVAAALGAAIVGDEPDGLPRFADGVRAVRVTDAVLASAAGGRWVDV